MAHWSRPYLGLPYADRGRSRTGMDCWGLPFIAFPAELGVAVPDYASSTLNEAEQRELDALCAGRPVDTWRRVDDPEVREFDLVWFRSERFVDQTHVGIVLRPGLMLHAYRDAGCVVTDRYDAGAWRHFLIGFYRHREMERPHAA